MPRVPVLIVHFKAADRSESHNGDQKETGTVRREAVGFGRVESRKKRHPLPSTCNRISNTTFLAGPKACNVYLLAGIRVFWVPEILADENFRSSNICPQFA